MQLKAPFLLLPYLALLPLSFGACHKQGEASSWTVASAGDFSNKSGMATTGSKEEEDQDEEAKDYWKDINFGRSNFEEVRQQVKNRYLDPQIDEHWTWGEAATFAAGSHPDKSFILLPEAFYKARKDREEEKGKLNGKSFKLMESDDFVFLEPVDKDQEDDEPKKRLSDEELQERRDYYSERANDLHRAWDAINFGEQDFSRVMRYLEKNLEETDEWSMKHAWIAASQGFLYALDPHSSLIPKASWDESNKKTQDSSFEGIGAILTQRIGTDFTIVESPIYGQPAVKAGVRAGDRIIAVDGKNIKGEGLSKVVSRIRGPAGTSVTLTIEREGEPESKDISITRSTIKMKNVQGELLEGYDDVASIKVTGYVKTNINGVTRTTDDDLKAEFERLSKLAPDQKLKGLVLDLRNNSGGLLREGIKMADRFLNDGIIVSVKSRDPSNNEVYRATKGNTWDIPVVVLVNDGTASAAEIVASALQDNRRALVIGDRTFGKASVQTLFFPFFQDDYYIKLTVARYYGPSEKTLQVSGVKPDLMVPPEYNGKMPLGFREENLSGHLVQLDHDYPETNKAWAKRAEACAKASGKAKKLLDKDPNPAIKFDWQLYYAADIVLCSEQSREK